MGHRKSRSQGPHRAVIETLEDRRLLTVVTSASLWLDNAPQSVDLVFSGDIDVESVSTTDIRLEKITGDDQDPVVTGVYADFDRAYFDVGAGSGSGVLASGNYRLTIDGDDILDYSGQPLTADFSADLFFLAGDLNHDRSVNITDNSILATHWQTAQDFPHGDASYDGFVDISDSAIVATNWQVTLPPAPTGPGYHTVGLQTATSIEMNWVDNVTGETGWRVAWALDGQTFDHYINVPGDNDHYILTGLENGKRYHVRVRAYGNGQDTGYTPKTG